MNAKLWLSGTLVLVSILLPAAPAEKKRNSAETGDFISALREPDARTRMTALAECLESAPADSRLIVRYLATELELSGGAREIFEKLNRAWTEHPADLPLATLANRYALAGGMPASIRMATLGKTMNAAAPRSQVERDEYLALAGEYLRILLTLKEYGSGKTFLDENSGRIGSELDALALNFYREAAFREYDSRPDYKSWAALPSDARWKREYERTLKTLRANEEFKTPAEGAARLMLYSTHKIPAAAELARALNARFPRSEEHLNSALFHAAGTMKDRKLYDAVYSRLPEMSNPIFQAWALAEIDETAEARRIVAKLSPAEVRMIECIALCQEKKFAEIRDLAMKLPKDASVSDAEIGVWVVAAETLRDPALLRRTMAAAGKMLERPATANAVGFVAAVLNVELDTAEKLISSACKADPSNMAYLDSMAYLRFRQGKAAEAKKMIARVLENRSAGDGGLGTLLLHAAEIEFAATGDKAAARSFLERAEKCAKDDDTEYDYAAAKKLGEALK